MFEAVTFAQCTYSLVNYFGSLKTNNYLKKEDKWINEKSVFMTKRTPGKAMKRATMISN